MAASWRGAWRWRSRVSSTERGGGGSGRHPNHNQRPPQPYLADYINNNYGIGSTTTSGTGTCTLSNTTYTTTATTSSSASAVAARVLHSFMPAPNTSKLVVEDDAEELSHGSTVTDKTKTREHMRDLIHGSSDPLDRWLWELQVSWVLHLAQLDASAGRAFISRRLQHTARSWVLALHGITRSIVSFTGWWCPSQEDEEEEEEALQQLQTCWPPTSELAGFFTATLMQMLPFVDTVVALKIIDPSSSDDDHQIVSGSRGGVASAHKFQALADVRDALAATIENVQLWEFWLCSSRQLHDTEATKPSSVEMSSLLVAKLDRLDVAIRDTRDYIRTQFMSLTRDRHHDTSTASGLEDLSPGVHKVTKSALSCIIVMSTSYRRSAVDPPPTVHEAAASVRVHGKDTPAATGDENTGSSTNLIMVIIRSLEEKLTRLSESFPDQSLGFLFLINNFYFVWHQLRTNQRLVDVPMYALTHKINGYINSYMQVSWTPVLEPLLHDDHTPCCCFTGYSAQHKFKTMFEKTYNAQKLWKVPDPELREELRTAIIKKVIPAFTNFLEDNIVSASRVTPKEIEEMLEELFEG